MLLLSLGSLCLCRSLSLCLNSVAAVSALDNSVSNSACNKLYGTDSVVVTGNNIVNLVRVAVCVNNSYDRQTKLCCL